jgi:Cft2 family RNA processing exonuclease
MKVTFLGAGAGMCNAGRILHHLKHNLWHPDTAVMWVAFKGFNPRMTKLLGLICKPTCYQINKACVVYLLQYNW